MSRGEPPTITPVGDAYSFSWPGVPVRIEVDYFVETRGDLYAELEQTARCNLEARQTQLRRRMREAGHTYKECKAVSKLHVIDADVKLKAIFENIVKRESARAS